MSTAVKRACDACHRRKVKCDGVNPCRNCSSALLACTYNAIPQKKGPKGSRAKVISELRENQRQSSLSAKIQNRINAVGSPSIATLAPTQGLLTNEMVKACIDFFFANMYPTMPILSRQRVELDAMSMDTTLDTYCLLCSLCAFMMLQPGMPMPASDPYGPESIPGASIITATLLLEETIRVRKGYDHLQNPTLYTIATSYFLFACHYGLDLQDKAWCNLREATTLVHLVRMNKEETYQAWDVVDAARRRRLFWLLYAAERAFALQNDRPISLKATVAPPTPADDPSDPYAGQLAGFCGLVSLFRPFDDAFVDLWNKTRSGCGSSLVAALQKQHNDVIGTLAAADPQMGDVVRNQQWLQNLAWQINLAKGNGDPSGGDVAAYQYSLMDLSREMIPMAAAFSGQGSSDLLNSGLIESLLTVTSHLTDVLSMMPSSGNPFSATPRDHLHQLANILAMLRIGEHRFAPLLLVKVHEVLPRLINPMLQSPPETACEIDLFDGFGTAGMVPQPYLPVDEFKAEASSSHGGASTMDVNSPFVSSPPILSPGMDFSHSMSTEFTPISDIVMNQSVPSSVLPLSPGSGVSNGQQQLQSQRHVQVPTQQHQPHQPHQSHQSQPPPQQQQQQQQQHSPEIQQQHEQHHLTHQLSQQQQHNHQQLPQQQQHLPQQHTSQQHFQQQHVLQQQQRQQQQHMHQQHHPSVAMLHGLAQGLGGDIPMQLRMNGGLTSSSGMDPPVSMANALGGQAFAGSAGSINGINNNQSTNNLTLRPQSQRAASFGIVPPQLRTVGDFQALQRANSDISSLTSLGMNNLGADLDFGTLR